MYFDRDCEESEIYIGSWVWFFFLVALRIFGLLIGYFGLNLKFWWLKKEIEGWGLIFLVNNWIKNGVFWICFGEFLNEFLSFER